MQSEKAKSLKQLYVFLFLYKNIFSYLFFNRYMLLLFMFICWNSNTCSAK